MLVPTPAPAIEETNLTKAGLATSRNQTTIICRLKVAKVQLNTWWRTKICQNLDNRFGGRQRNIPRCNLPSFCCPSSPQPEACECVRDCSGHLWALMTAQGHEPCAQHFGGRESSMATKPSSGLMKSPPPLHHTKPETPLSRGCSYRASLRGLKV